MWLDKPWRLLVVALLLETVVLVMGQGDFVASDPLWYAQIGHQLSVHPADVFAAHETHPFVMRVGLTFPLALFYRLFGVSILVSNLPSLLGALGITLVVYAAAPTARAKALGLAACVVSAPLAHHGTVLNVDLPSSALMACTVLCLSRRDRGAHWLVGGVVAWFVGFLVKETALWCGVVWVYALACDVRTLGGRAAVRRHAPAFAVGAVLGGAYLAVCAAVWGNALARFAGIKELTFEHAWALPGHPLRAWIDRLTWETPWLMVKMFQALLVPAIAGGWLVRGPERIWAFATAAFALLYWFGSSSTSAYAPLPISPRMILPVLPGLLVLAAIGADRAWGRVPRAAWIVVAAAIVVPGLLTDVALLRRERPEADAFAVLRGELRDRNVVLLCAEPRCGDIATFYFDFALPAHLTVEMIDDFARAQRPAGALVRVLVNKPRAEGSRSSNPSFDRIGPVEALHLPMLAGNASIHLDDAGDGEALWSALQSR